MSTELAMAVALIGLGLVQMVLTAVELRRVHGVVWANAARDTPSGKPDTPLLGRLQRAQVNLMETAPYFIGLVLIIEAAGLQTSLTGAASITFVLARLAYLPLYAFGVPWVRGLVWSIGFLALLALAFVAIDGAF